MRKIFYVAAAFALTSVLTLSAATRTETYTYNGEPSSPSSSPMYANKVNVAIISNEGNYWALNCFGAGDETCSWENAGCPPCEEIYTPFGDPNSLYELGDVDNLIKYAETQIVSGTYSGTHNANIIIGVNTYYRTVNWVYNTTSGKRNCTVTITEVTP